METKDYPYWGFTKKEWLKDVRKRWTVFRALIYYSNIRTGCVCYPDKVYEWLSQFEEMDKLMKEYYKNA